MMIIIIIKLRSHREFYLLPVSRELIRSEITEIGLVFLVSREADVDNNFHDLLLKTMIQLFQGTQLEGFKKRSHLHM